MSDADKVKVTVRVFGDPYTVLVDDDAEYVRKVADYVEETLNDIQSKNPYLGRTQAAVFGALSIADKYTKLKNDYEELLKVLNSEEPPGKTEPNVRRRRKRRT